MICRLVGCACVPLPQVAAEQGDMNRHTVAILREVADVLQTPAQVMADRRVSAEDAALVDLQVDEAVRALLAYKQHIRDQAALGNGNGKR